MTMQERNFYFTDGFTTVTGEVNPTGVVDIKLVQPKIDPSEHDEILLDVDDIEMLEKLLAFLKQAKG